MQNLSQSRAHLISMQRLELNYYEPEIYFANHSKNCLYIMFLEDISELSRWSHKQVSVVCDFQESELCLRKIRRMYMNVCITMDRNNGRYIRPFCLKMKLNGRNNPNCKYKDLDDHLMDIIDSSAKAYLLGWIAADGTISPNGNIGIAVNTCDVGVLEIICDFICPNLHIADCKKGAMKVLRICSSQWCKAVKEHLNLSFDKGESHKKSHLVQMPVNISDPLKWCFLHGLFEGDGNISIVKVQEVGLTVCA